MIALAYGGPPFYASDYACHVDKAGDSVMYSDVYVIPYSNAGLYAWIRAHAFEWQVPAIPLESLGPQSCGVPKTKYGNPIDAATGNKYQEEVDLAGLNGERFSRHYNSKFTDERTDGALGRGWTHSYDYRLVADPSGWSVKLYRPGGAVIELLRSSTSTWASQSKPTLKGEPIIQDMTTAGWRVSSGKPGSEEEYDAQGRLVALHVGTAQELHFAYGSAGDASRVLNASALSGRSLAFAYTPQGMLDRVTGPDGNFAQYRYRAGGILDGVQYGDSTSRHYVYGLDTASQIDPRQLTGIVDESGTQYASFGYDDAGRAASSTHVGGAGAVIVRYDVADRYITLPSGSTRRLAISGGSQVRVASELDYCNDCTSRLVNYDYRADGSLQKITDADVVTELDADDCGFERKRVEASGTPVQRTIEQDRDAAWVMPAEMRILDAGGNVVRRERRAYGEDGQLTSVELVGMAGSRATVYGYCTSISSSCPFKGLLQSIRTPGHGDASTTIFEYYSADDDGCSSGGHCRWRKGDLSRGLAPLGQTVEYLAYDGAGRPLAIRDQNGLLTQLSYDARGRLVSQSLQDGTTARTTSIAYALTGQVSSILYPDGVTIGFQYDGAQRLTKVLDGSGGAITYTLDAAGNRTKEQVTDASGAIKRSLQRSYTLLG